ncbi:MAG: hypothetical protein HUJ96_07865 [Marinilabiliaceae bacterium]|nr:hypothetical protein [Marinilabiliaceae bacterium]
MKKTILLLFAAVLFAACGAKQSSQEQQKSKSLVVYYSQTGATAQVAAVLAEMVGAALDSIVAVRPYDGDFQATIARCQAEMESGEQPEIKALNYNVADYDTLYVGFPVWFGTMAPPVISWAKSVDLSGKVIVPFCTFGSGGLNTSVADLKNIQANATFVDGYGVRNARVAKAASELEVYLVRKGIKKGEVADELPFSEQLPITEAEKAVFDAACGSYPMPLGSPVSFGKRDIMGGAEYLFVVESQAPNGTVSQSQIYVVTSNEEGVAPEFTHVDR